MATPKKSASMSAKKAYDHIRKRASRYPETREDYPWGECAVKVRGKTFLFMRLSETGLGLSMKLPQSREFALEYPFTQPTGYGLGKSGWVSLKFGPNEKPPLDIIEAWLDESYRAVAPKKLVATLTS